MRQWRRSHGAGVIARARHGCDSSDSSDGDVLARILSSGRTVSTMDLLIGTVAVVEDAALLTANHSHFQTVPDLRLLSYRVT